MACSLVDFNRDGWSDLLVTLNNQPIEAFEARPHPRNRLLLIQLVGPPGNQDCVGARVTVSFEKRPSQTAEVGSGGGYLSQSTTILSFGCERSQPQQVLGHVRTWSHGAGAARTGSPRNGGRGGWPSWRAASYSSGFASTERSRSPCASGRGSGRARFGSSTLGKFQTLWPIAIASHRRPHPRQGMRFVRHCQQIRL